MGREEEDREMRRGHNTGTAAAFVVALLAVLPLGADVVLADDVRSSSWTESPSPEPSPDPPGNGNGNGNGKGGKGGDGDGDEPSPSETPSPSPTPTSSPSPSPDPTTSPEPGAGPPSPSDPRTSDGSTTDTAGPAASDPAESRERGAAGADASPRRTNERSQTLDSPDPTPPTSSPWLLMTGDAQGVESVRFPARTAPPHEPNLSLALIAVLALTLLPFLFHKMREEWRS